jgi:hypothetical protein
MTNNKKRKIEEQDASSSVEFPPPFTTDTLRHRLQTGIMVQSGGQKGSLTRCVQKFALLSQSQSEQGDSKQKQQQQDILHELRLYQMDLTRRVLLQQTLEKENKENQKSAEDLKQQMQDMSAQVGESFQQADRSKQVQSCFMEYEALAKLVNASLKDNTTTTTTTATTTPTTSSRKLRADIAQVQQEIAEYEQEEAKLDQALEVRSSQFQLLIQCMLDLKRSLDDKDMAEDIQTTKASSSKDAKENDNEAEGTTLMKMPVDDLYGDIS